MEEATVTFQVDFSDENIKRKVMEAVSNFPGVTFVDIKEKGKLMVRGKFKEIEIGLELRNIDKSIVFGTKGKAKQSLFYQTLTSLLPSGNVPNMQVSIIKVLDIRKANTVIWEFSGVTSVEYKGFDQLEVKGEFNILEMVEKLKEIDIYVSVLDQDLAEKLRNDEADKKLRLDKEKADKARIEKAKADKARIEKDEADKKLRLDKEKADKKLRRDKENAEAINRLTTQIKGTANPAHSQQTGGFISSQPTSTANPSSTQQTRASRSTLPSSTTNPSDRNLKWIMKQLIGALLCKKFLEKEIIGRES